VEARQGCSLAGFWQAGEPCAAARARCRGRPHLRRVGICRHQRLEPLLALQLVPVVALQAQLALGDAHYGKGGGGGGRRARGVARCKEAGPLRAPHLSRGKVLLLRPLFERPLHCRRHPEGAAPPPHPRSPRTAPWAVCWPATRGASGCPRRSRWTAPHPGTAPSSPRAARRAAAQSAPGAGEGA
jgi:hypothetical protein